MHGSRRALRRTASLPPAWSGTEPSARDRCVPTPKRRSTPARAAQTTRRASSASESAQFLNRDVLVPGFDLATSVHLQTDQAVTRNLRIGFGVVNGLTTVDRETDTGTLGADLVIVPVARFQNLLDHLWRRGHQRLVAA